MSTASRVADVAVDVAADVVFFVGIAAIATGLWMLYGEPVGLVAAGVGLVVAALVRLIAEATAPREVSR